MRVAKIFQVKPKTYKKYGIFILQGFTALGIVISMIMMTSFGPLTLFIFMTVGQGLLLFSLILSIIILITHKNIARENFRVGEIIFRKGDVGDKLYVITDGEVEIVEEERDQVSKGRIIATLGRGDCFGEMALVNDQPRGATARCKTRVSLLSLDREGFQDLVVNLPPLRRIFEQMIEERTHSPMRDKSYERE